MKRTIKNIFLTLYLFVYTLVIDIFLYFWSKVKGYSLLPGN